MEKKIRYCAVVAQLGEIRIIRSRGRLEPVALQTQLGSSFTLQANQTVTCTATNKLVSLPGSITIGIVQAERLRAQVEGGVMLARLVFNAQLNTDYRVV